MSESTRRPVSPEKVAAPTNSRAARVSTTSTNAPSFCSARTSNTALYAATLPLTQTVIRLPMKRCGALDGPGGGDGTRGPAVNAGRDWLRGGGIGRSDIDQGVL